MKRLSQFIGGLSIRARILSSIIVLMLSIAVILEVGINYYVSDMVEESAVSNMQSMIQIMADNINMKLGDVNTALYDIAVDGTVQAQLGNINRSSFSSVYELAQARKQIQDQIDHYSVKISNLLEIRIIVEEDKDIVAGGINYHQFQEEVPYQEIQENSRASVWKCDLIEDVIVVYKQIRDTNTEKPLGILCAYLDRAYLFDGLEENREGGDTWYLVSSGGTAVDTGEEISDAGYYGKYEMPLLYNEWSLCLLKDLNPARDDLRSLQISAMVLIAAMTGLMALLYFILAKSISSPIIDLTRYMQKFAGGNLDIAIPVKYHNEIGVLQQNFNEMTQKIKRLMEKTLEEEQLRKDAQLSALEMQINPHFFYNTLNTIYWLAKMHENDDIAQVSEAFGKLMRFSLKGDTNISFEEELESVKNYMIIQKFRFGNTLILEEKIEEEVLYEYTPKHILLPLIENSIEHGFQGKEDNKKIILHGRLVEGRGVEIKLYDNGCGMSRDTLDQISEGKFEKKSGRHMAIGVQNVRKRLELLYGGRAGLEIKSREGRGTLIVVRIPEETEEDLQK